MFQMNYILDWSCNLEKIHSAIVAKESNSTANESKWQYNRSIIYSLNIVSIVNDSFWKFKKKKIEHEVGIEPSPTTLETYALRIF